MLAASSPSSQLCSTSGSSAVATTAATAASASTAAANVSRRQQTWHRALSSKASTRHATTVLCVRKDGEVVLVADGQVTQDDFIVKANAR